nr:VacJ family lipoprotein [Roseovarius azorensis]
MPAIASLLRHTPRAAALLGLVVIVACARPDPSAPTQDIFDPYEQSNRDVHQFNRSLDRAFVRPVAKGYSAAIPDDIETVIGRVSQNLSLPSDIINNMLQLNMRGAIQDTARFVVNSTVGLGGTFDPASEMGMAAPTNTDFGETLHVWGAREGAYVELPVLGPSTERDTWGLAVDLFTNPLTYILDSPENLIGTAAGVASGLSNREKFSDTIDQILYESADSYAQSRSIYLQNRRFKLGGTSGSVYDDPYDTPAPSEVLEDPYAE